MVSEPLLPIPYLCEHVSVSLSPPLPGDWGPTAPPFTPARRSRQVWKLELLLGVKQTNEQHEVRAQQSVISISGLSFTNTEPATPGFGSEHPELLTPGHLFRCLTMDLEMCV
ncbi:Eukaryotic translation initiation factor 3 subunit L [Platysternon megacephalum]|uniref:Eukaryotic translation initiation factor 3 subunit L n=1 Tax=Platysternon megacephalum TaxID=55544 RepID=A0A4D9DNK5_9SAUR|nr:Eukaryotic translation initiation factor 3 subunit L [Platysternon megacephalum]